MFVGVEVMQQSKPVLTHYQIRDGLTNIVLGSAAILVVFATLASIMRYKIIGFQPIMLVHVILAILIFSLFLLRKDISLSIRANAICCVFFLAGIGGILSFGLAGAGSMLTVGACVLASFLVSMRLAIFFAVSGGAVLGIFSVFAWLGKLQFSINEGDYLLSVEAWFNNLIAYSYLVTISLLLIQRFSVYLNSFVNSQAEIIQSQTVKIQTSESILEAVVNSLPYGILWKDTELRYLGANRYFLDDIKVTDLKEIIGKTDHEILPLDMAKRFTQLDEKILLRGDFCEDYQEEHLNTEGKKTYISASRKRLTSKEGKLLGVLSAYHDITERTLMLIELRQAKQLAEQANLAKSQFLANMSHEIRTPLNGILGLIKLCLLTSLSPPQLDYLTKANLSANTLLNIINDILDISKIEAGQMELETISFALQDILENINNQFTYVAKVKGIQFFVEYQGPEALWVVGDPTRLLQVLMNLCSNGIKFTEQGHVLVVCSASTSAQNACIKFKISDSGIGIDELALPYLFSKFTQVDSSISRKFGGTGLGLSIIKGLANLMGGIVTVNSQLGSGTCFELSITLPLGENTCIAQANNQNVDLSGKQILLVEDNEINRVIVNELLVSVGANVSTAENGQIALDQLLRAKFDIVLMDIQMPVMDGCSAIVKIRTQEKYQTLPIVALTANAMQHEIDLYKRLGFDAHVPKPFDFDVLLNLIHRLTKN
jgi:signal transduction histidine kinase/ActR/RegA family two-component response regulator